MRLLKTILAGGVLLTAMACASAGTVTLNGTATSTADANIAEQATIVVPAEYDFAVTDITQNTPVTGTQAVTLSNIVLGEGKAIQLSVTAGTANFSTVGTGTVTYAATDVVWVAPTDAGVTGASGALVSGSAQSVGQSTANNPAGSLTFTVPFVLDKHTAANIDRAGTESLTLTWTATSL